MKIPGRKPIFLPFLASVPMGLAAFLSYQGLHAVLKSNFLALIPAIVLGAGIYFVVYLAAAKPDAGHWQECREVWFWQK